MGSNHQKSQFDRARDEFCSHVIRCDVLEAHMEDRLEWLEETMDYMADRYPDLTELELAQLEVVGRRFVKPVIPHGSHAHAGNRERWEQDETGAEAQPDETVPGVEAQPDETVPGVEAQQGDPQKNEAEPLMAGVA
jgi:hypothetical protein